MQQILIDHLGHFLLEFYCQIWTLRHILGPIYHQMLCMLKQVLRISNAFNSMYVDTIELHHGF